MNNSKCLISKRFIAIATDTVLMMLTLIPPGEREVTSGEGKKLASTFEETQSSLRELTHHTPVSGVDRQQRKRRRFDIPLASGFMIEERSGGR